MAAVQSLEAFPERGRRTAKPGIRELVVPFGQSAYVLRYARRKQSGEIVVLRVWHAREEREDW